jgi:hypothetical protein
MNTGRFIGAAVAVWLVRTLLNAGFYGYLMHGEFERLDAAHPGMFREVIPAFIALDLLVALLLVYMIVKAASCFGGGMKGAVTIAVLIAIFGPIIFSLYYYFSTTFYTLNVFGIEAVYQLVTHAIQGAVAAAIYKAA